MTTSLAARLDALRDAYESRDLQESSLRSDLPPAVQAHLINTCTTLDTAIDWMIQCLAPYHIPADAYEISERWTQRGYKTSIAIAAAGMAITLYGAIAHSETSMKIGLTTIVFGSVPGFLGRPIDTAIQQIHLRQLRKDHYEHALPELLDRFDIRPETVHDRIPQLATYHYHERLKPSTTLADVQRVNNKTPRS